MTPPADRLAEIRARADKATPGQWRLWSRGEPTGEWIPAWALRVGMTVGCCGIGPFDKPVISQWSGYGFIRPEDEAFLLHAREDVPWLLVELARVTAENGRLREALLALEAWVSGYAQDDVPNERFHATGGFEIMERARAASGGTEGP